MKGPQDRPLPRGRMGLRLAVLSGAIALAAVNTGNNLLYLILSLVLGLAAISVASSIWSLRHLRFTAHLPELATCGQPILIGAEVRGRFPLLPQTWVDVSIKGLPEPVEMSVAVPVGTGHGISSGSIVASRRGVYDRLHVEATTGYPLDLSVHSLHASCDGTLVVLPRFTRLTRVKILGDARGGPGSVAAPGSRTAGVGAELSDLREYTPRDDARHIDWRSTARTGHMMVREFEPEQESRLEIVLDRASRDPDRFERLLEQCAAILDWAQRGGVDARLLATGEEGSFDTRAGMRYLAATSLLSPDDPCARLEPVLDRARRGARVVVLSCDSARATPLEIG